MMENNGEGPIGESPKSESAQAFAATIFDQVGRPVPEREGPAEFRRFFLKEVARRMEGFQPRTDSISPPHPGVEIARAETFVPLDPRREERIDFILKEADEGYEEGLPTIDFYYAQPGEQGDVSLVRVHMARAEDDHGTAFSQLFFDSQTFQSTFEVNSELRRFFRGEAHQIDSSIPRLKSIDSEIFNGESGIITLHERVHPNDERSDRKISTHLLLNQHLFPYPTL